MIETIFGVILGGAASWIITHWYYKKQERSSPIPIIKEVNETVKEIYNLSVVRGNRELLTKLNKLDRLITIASHRIMHLLLPLDVDTLGLYEIYKSGDKQKFNQYLNEVLPRLFKFHEKVSLIVKELGNLKETTAKLAQGENDIDDG